MELDPPDLNHIKEQQMYLMRLRQEQRIKEIMQSQKEQNDKIVKNVSLSRTSPPCRLSSQ